MTRPLNPKTTSLSLALAVASVCSAAYANPVTGALGETKPIIDLRLRYETVDQLGIANEADALVARARLGFETGKAWSTALLVEGEFVGALKDDYREDNSVAVNTTYPVVPDPDTQEINRFQLTNTSIANTTITLGRQRINLDDQRFVGNVGWRMNEQTYDALRVVNKPGGGNFTIDVTYANRANRIFGDGSPQGDYKGDLGFVNLAYQFRIGKLTAFDYALDFDPIVIPGFAALNPARVSTNTYGLRFSGERPLSKVKLGYTLSYAKQTDLGDNVLATPANPNAVDNDYKLIELTGTYKQYSLLLGHEELSGTGTAGFSTPLATLHKFQGWVDKFLTTPANGIKDSYAQLTAAYKGVGPIESLTAAVAYHTYDAEHVNADYGTEFNASLAAKKGRFTGTLKYGDYKADTTTPTTVARDTSKFWAQIDFVW